MLCSALGTWTSAPHTLEIGRKLYALQAPVDTKPNVLEALKRRASRDRHCGDRRDNGQELDRTILHGIARRP